MTIQRHMFVQLLVASVVITTTLSSVLILVSLFAKVPSAVLYSKAVVPLILGAIPINFSNVLPIGVAIAAAWYYTNLVSDRAIDVLYATGISYFSVVLPALLLALLAAILGFYLSFVEAPRGWAQLLDAIHIGTHGIDASKLEPQRFYVLNDNRRVFYFGHWLSSDEIAQVFMQERTDGGGERTITAPFGALVRTPNTTLLNLADAVVLLRKAGERAPEIISFNRLWIDSGMRGSEAPERSSRSLAELGPVAFAAGYDHGDQRYRREWTIEAFKRTIPPIVTVIYLLVAIRLALLGLGARQEASWKFYAICLGVIAHHGLLLLAVDVLITLDRQMAWAVVAVIAIEICMGILATFNKFSTKQIFYDGNTLSAGRMASGINDVS